MSIQPIADRSAQHLEIISKTIPTNQNSADGIYDWYQVINDESHENPDTPGTKFKVFGNNLQMLCHPICNWLYQSFMYSLFSFHASHQSLLRLHAFSFKYSLSNILFYISSFMYSLLCSLFQVFSFMYTLLQ